MLLDIEKIGYRDDNLIDRDIATDGGRSSYLVFPVY